MKKYQVVSNVATVWNQPTPRPVDEPALANNGVAEWVDGMSTEDSKGLESGNLLATQAYFNDEVWIDRFEGDWAHVYVPDQADDGDEHGYPGWIYRAQLTNKPSQMPAGPKVIIRQKFAPLFDAEGRTLLHLSFGTQLVQLAVIDDRFISVATPLGEAQIWRSATQFTEAETKNTDGETMLAVGQRYLDLRYLWAGTSSYGFDCSGFVYALHRSLGYLIPRDADDQARSGKPVDYQDLQVGDLVFFAHDHGQGYVHHVGLYAGDDWILNAFTPGKYVSWLHLPESHLWDEIVGGRRYWGAGNGK